jgi:glutamine amidotransferase
MCRVLAYLGQPVLLDEMLYEPEAGLVRQAVDPQLMGLLNLGGFGLAAWAPTLPDPSWPVTYRVPTVPNFDRNLRALARKVEATAIVAHVRGVIYDERERVGTHNVHPFLFPGATVALAQNGDLYDFGRMRFDLVDYVRPDLAAMIEGTTDSEWVYALILSMLDDPFAQVEAADAAAAVERALDVLREVRSVRGISVQSPVNLVLTDGRWLLATRFAFDYGWYPDDGSFFAGEREHDFTSLWFRAPDGEGADASVIIASEPLSRHHAGWFEVPEYSMLVVERGSAGDLRLSAQELPW